MILPWPVLLLTALALAACSEDWPLPARGGAAELHPPVLAADATHPADPAQLGRLQCAVARYGALRHLSDAIGQRTGEVTLEGYIATEAQREYAAFMRCDTDRTIAKLDADISSTASALGDPGEIPPPCV